MVWNPLRFPGPHYLQLQSLFGPFMSDLIILLSMHHSLQPVLKKLTVRIPPIMDWKRTVLQDYFATHSLLFTGQCVPTSVYLTTDYPITRGLQECVFLHHQTVCPRNVQASQLCLWQGQHSLYHRFENSIFRTLIWNHFIFELWAQTLKSLSNFIQKMTTSWDCTRSNLGCLTIQRLTTSQVKNLCAADKKKPTRHVVKILGRLCYCKLVLYLLLTLQFLYCICESRITPVYH